MTTITDICAELDIEIIPVGQSARKPGQTCAGRILQKVLDDEGENHLRSVLMTIVQSENNRFMLTRPVILAISDVLRTHPAWFGGDWLDEFDKIDLAEMYEQARRDREGVPPRNAICARIIDRLRPKFKEDGQDRLL